LGGDYGAAAQQPPGLPAEESRIFLVSDNFREAEGRAATARPDRQGYPVMLLSQFTNDELNSGSRSGVICEI
jgi:hypothetical protein